MQYSIVVAGALSRVYARPMGLCHAGARPASVLPLGVTAALGTLRGVFADGVPLRLVIRRAGVHARSERTWLHGAAVRLVLWQESAVLWRGGVPGALRHSSPRVLRRCRRSSCARNAVCEPLAVLLR